MHTCRARAPHSYAYASNPKTRNAQLETEMLIVPLVNSCREVQRRWSLRTRLAMTGQNSARCACAPSQPCAIAGRAGRAERAGCSLRKVAKVPGTRGGRARARVQNALYIVASPRAPEDLDVATNQCLVRTCRRRMCSGAGGWLDPGRTREDPASPSNRSARSFGSGG